MGWFEVIHVIMELTSKLNISRLVIVTGDEDQWQVLNVVHTLVYHSSTSGIKEVMKAEEID